MYNRSYQFATWGDCAAPQKRQTLPHCLVRSCHPAVKAPCTLLVPLRPLARPLSLLLGGEGNNSGLLCYSAARTRSAQRATGTPAPRTASPSLEVPPRPARCAANTAAPTPRDLPRRYLALGAACLADARDTKGAGGYFGVQGARTRSSTPAASNGASRRNLEKFPSQPRMLRQSIG